MKPVTRRYDGAENELVTTPLSHVHTQAESHYSADTDGSTSSLHHTLGTGATQAAAGNHTHSRFGGSTNYTEFESDGTMVAHGNATTYDDLVAAISGTVVVGVGVSVNGTEQRIEYTNTANTSDYAWTSYQLRHAWKSGSSLHPHIHWEQNSANVPNWLIQYRWQINGGAKTTGWTNYKCNTAVFSYSSGTLNQICHGAGLTPPVGYGISDIIQIRVLRDTANSSGLFAGADPAAGTQSITSNDIHIETDTLGSRTEYTK